MLATCSVTDRFPFKFFKSWVIIGNASVSLATDASIGKHPAFEDKEATNLDMMVQNVSGLLRCQIPTAACNWH